LHLHWFLKQLTILSGVFWPFDKIILPH
jgi:hypothetical protein